MDWFLYDNDLRLERVKEVVIFIILSIKNRVIVNFV